MQLSRGQSIVGCIIGDNLPPLLLGRSSRCVLFHDGRRLGFAAACASLFLSMMFRSEDRRLIDGQVGCTFDMSLFFICFDICIIRFNDDSFIGYKLN